MQQAGPAIAGPVFSVLKQIAATPRKKNAASPTARKTTQGIATAQINARNRRKKRSHARKAKKSKKNAEKLEIYSTTATKGNKSLSKAISLPTFTHK